MTTAAAIDALSRRADFEAIAQWVRSGARVLDLGCRFLVLGIEFWAIHNHLKACCSDLDALLGTAK